VRFPSAKEAAVSLPAGWMPMQKDRPVPLRVTSASAGHSLTAAKAAEGLGVVGTRLSVRPHLRGRGPVAAAHFNLHQSRFDQIRSMVGLTGPNSHGCRPTRTGDAERQPADRREQDPMRNGAVAGCQSIRLTRR
jgi:hypothetical protein